MLATTSQPYIMNSISPLCSHSPFSFASKPTSHSEMSRPVASRLHVVASWKLRSEAGKDEPRLRKLLGHISLFDQTLAHHKPQTPSTQLSQEVNELSTYLHHPVPSFKDFQAAIEMQLATMAEIKASAAQLDAQEYNSDEEEDEHDSDYDSYDGEWSEEDTAAESDDSYTDYEGSDGQWSACSSPTSCTGDISDKEDEDEEGLWAIRPQIPVTSPTSIHF
ncbi:hypothetical protein PV11_06570 [Exophiala sideris]|uniref:Uncharacterized protein n=1 Tax=Exophiala sideris TaxID=1016849 RepID=A0A0D1Y7Y0_9EURO|nr:hypothetical protein PV11_06570 [Exophiala sideris]